MPNRETPQERLLAKIRALLIAHGGFTVDYGTGAVDNACLHIVQHTYGYPSFTLNLEQTN